MITVEDFFGLLVDELKLNDDLKGYYKFVNGKNKSIFEFRKRYFCQRLDYINRNVGTQPSKVWDCGAGYGTTSIFLAMNGHQVYGNTLEFYYVGLNRRLEYWSQFCDLSKLEMDYFDHFDLKFKGGFDYVVAQDTLHHLEPIEEAIRIVRNSLRPHGKLIAVEENGKNIFINFKNYLKRGNHRIIEFYDERLKKEIAMGNENTRSIELWKILLDKNGMRMLDNSTEFVRLFLPPFYKFMVDRDLLRLESELWKNYVLRNYFYFGISFLSERDII